MWKRVSESARGRMAPCGEPPLRSIEVLISDRRLAGLAGRRLSLSVGLNGPSLEARLLQQSVASRRGSREGVLYPTEEARA